MSFQIFERDLDQVSLRFMGESVTVRLFEILSRMYGQVSNVCGLWDEGSSCDVLIILGLGCKVQGRVAPSG